MIDINKKYTYSGKSVRIYADGSDTYLGKLHGAYLSDNTWYMAAFKESDLVEVFEPKEGEVCFFWDNGDTNEILVSKFVKMQGNEYESQMGALPFDYCAPFKGELPEAFKGLV